MFDIVWCLNNEVYCYHTDEGVRAEAKCIIRRWDRIIEISFWHRVKKR